MPTNDNYNYNNKTNQKFEIILNNFEKKDDKKLSDENSKDFIYSHNNFYRNKESAGNLSNNNTINSSNNNKMKNTIATNFVPNSAKLKPKGFSK